MNIKIFSILTFCFFILGCAKNTVINNSYNFKQIKTIGITKFTAPKYVKGTEDLCYKYMVANGFNVIDNNKITSILYEYNLPYKNYLDLKNIKTKIETLDIEAVLTGEITYYKPSKEMVKTIQNENIYISPGLRSSYTNDHGSNGKIRQTTETSTSIDKETTTTPIVYSTSSEVGFILKLIDINTLDVIWVGSVSKTGNDNMDASENAIKYLIKQLKKDITKISK